MRSHRAAECSGCSTERIFVVQTVNFVEPGFSLMSSERRRSIDKKGSRQREVRVGLCVPATKACGMKSVNVPVGSLM